jgi:hypothetical protein
MLIGWAAPTNNPPFLVSSMAGAVQSFRWQQGKFFDGSAMTPGELAARYRDYALRCLLFAKQQDNVSDELVLIDMAQTWAGLADYAEKNGSVIALFEAPSFEWHR